jgi:L-ascorbate 6-phosphate lactonase
MTQEINRITRDDWVNDCFPEWGNWLLEDIRDTVVEPGTFASWWLGCTGIWIKSQANTNISIDMWCGTSRTTRYNAPPNMYGPNFQLGRMNGSNQINMNPRNIPHLLDPFAIEKIDAFVVTHDHNDHMDKYSSAAIFQNHPETPLIGPLSSKRKWMGWGVPEERITTVKPGDCVEVGDVKIHAVDAFDRTALITAPPEGSIVGNPIEDMDERAVNYVIETPGGTFYHSGDSHYSNYYGMHGKKFKIAVAIAAYGENPPGVTDKMTACDVLRMAEGLNCKVIIPTHYDVWPNFQVDPKEILMLYNFKKDRLKYQFKPYIWQVGGKFVYPDNKDDIEFMHPRGFTDAFENEPNLPFKAIL